MNVKEKIWRGYFYSKKNIIYFANEIDCIDNLSYFILYGHYGKVPAYHTERFDLIDKIIERMKVISGDLRLWKLHGRNDWRKRWNLQKKKK